tara:strand:+ start:522 stop:1028 length:507 start_codon:yes stop_codon:yes gene_type:complete
MRFIFPILFLLSLSCSSPFEKVERIYICGDHPCANDKEAKEYFNNNISIEVYSIDSDKDRKENFDLVELNLLEDKLKTKEKISVSKKKKEIKERIKERKKLAKLKIKKIEEPKKTKETLKSKEIIKKKKKTKFTFIRICKNFEECDIDKISKIIMDIGKEKDFPDISN